MGWHKANAVHRHMLKPRLYNTIDWTAALSQKVRVKTCGWLGEDVRFRDFCQADSAREMLDFHSSFLEDVDGLSTVCKPSKKGEGFSTTVHIRKACLNMV